MLFPLQNQGFRLARLNSLGYTAARFKKHCSSFNPNFIHDAVDEVVLASACKRPLGQDDPFEQAFEQRALIIAFRSCARAPQVASDLNHHSTAFHSWHQVRFTRQQCGAQHSNDQL